MGDLSKFRQEDSLVVSKIYEWHAKMGDEEKPRPYLGASIIGHACDRFLWYSFRHCIVDKKSGRILRLFETGHLEEPRFVRELRGIGCEVHDKDEKGEQFGVSAIGGHFKGHMDGVLRGVPGAEKSWHVFEGKTFGGEETHSKDFEKVKKVGVESAKPVHYAQMQVYMGLNKIKRSLYLAKKKSTDELYSERVKFNPDRFKGLMERAERIIRSASTPERCTTRADDFRCKFCPAYNLCWGAGETAVPLPCRSCRSCIHSTPEIDDGENWQRWSCSKHEKNLDNKDQLAACDDHLLLPSLISFATAVDSGEDWIKFENGSDGASWLHGKNASEGHWSTNELIATATPVVRSKIVNEAKRVFGGTVRPSGEEEGE